MLRPPVGCEVRPVARLGVAAGPGLRGSFRRARIRSVFPGLEIAVVDGTRIVVFLVLAVPVAALTVRRIQKAREDQRVVVDRRRRLIDRRVDPDVDGSLMLCNLARSLFMRVQAARDSADRDALAQLVSGDALRGIELCRVKVDGKPKVFYAGTRAGVTDRHDGAVFLIEAKLREYDTDDQGHERPRDCGERNVHEHWTLAAEGSDGPWKVVAIEADANLYGGPHELEAVAASMFVQVQAARDRGDAAELRRLVSGDLLRSIELFGGIRTRSAATWRSSETRRGFAMLARPERASSSQSTRGCASTSRTRPVCRWSAVAAPTSCASGGRSPWAVTATGR